MGLYCTAKNVTIWKIEVAKTKGGKEYVRLQCSTNKKNKQTGNYETDWSGTIDLWNGAYEKFKAEGLKERDKINILNCQHTNLYSKESKRTFENYNIWSGEDFEVANQTEYTQPTQPKEEKAVPVTMEEIDDSDLELPF